MSDQPKGLWSIFTRGEKAAYQLGFSSGYKKACEEILAKARTANMESKQVEEMLENANK
jgi:hypothetical protein